MKDHAELELLSSFNDGELDDGERISVERHLPGCDTCTEVLSALRLTVSDLRELPQAEPSAQDSWALRSAISAARRAESSKRYPRFVIATAGVAASIVAVLAFVMPQGNDGTVSQDNAGASAPTALGSTVQDYDESSASGLLQFRASNDAQGAPMAQEDTMAGRSSTELSSDCLQQIAPRDSALTNRFTARFKGAPARFYIFAVPAVDPRRLELWVTPADSCDTLFWAQRTLP